MLQRILVPTDGTAFSNQAVPIVRGLAKAHGAEVVLVQVVDFNPALGLPDEWLGAPDLSVELIDALEAEAKEALSARAADFRGDGLSVKAVLLRGTVAASLLNYELEEQPDLVVMATHARTGLERLVLGSVTDRMVLEGNAPVLLVRTSIPVPATLERALVPLDGSPLAEEALLVIETLAGQSVHAVRLLRAVEGEGERELAGVYLREVAAGLAAGGLQVQTEIRVDAPVGAIEAATEDVDVVVMATHGRGGLDRIRHGSVTQELTRRLAKPIIVQRPRLRKLGGDLAHFLSNVRLFAQLEPKLLAKLATFAQERSYGAGDVIVREGDVGVGLFIIRTGRAEALERHDGRDERLRLMGVGDVFGEIAVLERTARTATVRALEPTTCLMINGLTLRNVLGESPETLKEFDAMIAVRLATHPPGAEAQP